jgi:hypothetical protein
MARSQAACACVGKATGGPVRILTACRTSGVTASRSRPGVQRDSLDGARALSQCSVQWWGSSDARALMRSRHGFTQQRAKRVAIAGLAVTDFTSSHIDGRPCLAGQERTVEGEL